MYKSINVKDLSLLYQSQVKFPDGELVLSIGSFVRCWDVSVGVLARDVGTSALPTQLKTDIQLEKRLRLGNYVCVLDIFIL